MSFEEIPTTSFAGDFKHKEKVDKITPHDKDKENEDLKFSSSEKTKVEKYISRPKESIADPEVK